MRLAFPCACLLLLACSSAATSEDAPRPGVDANDAAALPPGEGGVDARDTGDAAAPPPGEGGVDAGDTGDGGRDDAPDGSGSDASDGAPPSTGTGLIRIINVAEEGYPSSRFNAEQATFHAGSIGCPTTTIAGCTITKCAGGVALPDTNAGTLTIGGGTASKPPYSILLDYQQNHYYAQAESQGSYFVPGDTLTVTTLGAIVPGFTASVVAPYTVNMTAPICNRPQCTDLTIDRTADLTVTWTGGANETVEFRQSTFNRTTGNTVTLVCPFTAPAQTGAVPAAAMSALERADSNVAGLITLGTTKKSTMQVGGWTISVDARFDGATYAYMDK
jgi:hypothetical protein